MADGAERKRKRTDEAPSRRKHKQKRVSIQEEPSTPSSATVLSVVRPQLSPPLIATTPGLHVAESVSFDSYTKPPKRSSKKRQDDTALRNLLLHSSAHGTMEYTGKEDGAAASLVKHYIGLFDPVSGQLQAVEARRLVIRGSVRQHRAPAEAMAAWTAMQTAANLKQELGEAFGTKKAKKAIRELTENAISPRKPGDTGDAAPRKMDAGELALVEAMKKTTATMATRKDLQAIVDLARPVPKGNYAAEHVGDVYLPDEIMGAEILASIPVRDWQQDCKAGKDIQLASRFVARRVNRTALEDSAKQLRVLRCLYWLVRCWQVVRPGKERGTWSLPRRDRLKTDLDSAPDLVLDKLRRTFSDQGVVRKFHKHLLMTHCCVLAIILDNFEVKLLDLAEDLKMEQKELGQYFLEIGARVRVSKAVERTETIAQLSLPLVFPQLRQRKRR